MTSLPGQAMRGQFPEGEPGIEDDVGIDEAIAARCRLPLLISAATDEAVLRVARRVHDACFGMSGMPQTNRPFLERQAADLPADADGFGLQWIGLVRGAAGGTLLLAGIHATPLTVQDTLAEHIRANGLGAPANRVRIITGTTVPLYECVLVGNFSEDLFYCLNAIHLVMKR
jgi:transcriptional regulator of aromatic amino acid metabolism